jgi:excisionase family DNA binding protein
LARSPRHPNPRLVKLHRPYSVDEAARLLGKHPHTVREWIKAGLPTVDGGRPTLIPGREMRTFLERRRAMSRRPCPRGTLYCFTCREPRAPAFAEVEFEPRDGAAGNLKALCETCGGLMRRRASHDRISIILPDVVVRIIAGAETHRSVQ